MRNLPSYLVHGHVRTRKKSGLKRARLENFVTVFRRQNRDVTDKHAQNPKTQTKSEVVSRLVQYHFQKSFPVVFRNVPVRFEKPKRFFFNFKNFNRLS